MDLPNIENILVIVAVIANTLAVVVKGGKVKELQSSVEQQFSKNGGSSLVDKVDNIVSKLSDLGHTIGRLEVWKTAWMELSDSPIFISNVQGHLSWANDEYLRTVGATFQDLAGMGWMKIIHPQDRESVKESWKISIETQSTFDMVYRIVNQQNQEVLSVRAKVRPLVRENTLAGFIGILDKTPDC